MRRRRADDQSTRAQGPEEGHQENEGARPPFHLQLVEEPDSAREGVATEARRVYAGTHDDAEEAELGPAQDRACAADERHRSDGVHPGRGALAAGALGGADSRRTREGPAGRALPHHPGGFGRAGRGEPEAWAEQVRDEKVVARWRDESGNSSERFCRNILKSQLL